MRLEHQIKNVINRVDEARSDHTPGQKVGTQEHPISKKTSDYEEKFFTIPGGEGKDDRDKFITGKKPEHPENVEDTESHENPTKKTHGKNGESKPVEEVEDVDEGLFDFNPRKKILDPSMFSSKKDDISQLITLQQKALAMKPGDSKRAAIFKEINKVKQRLGISEEVWEAIFFEEDLEDLNEMKPGYANGSTKPSDLAMCGYITNKTHMFIIKAQYKYEYWPVIGQNRAKESDQVMFKWEKDSEPGQGRNPSTLSGVPLQGPYRGKRFTYKIVTDTHRVASDELKKNRLLDEYNPEKDDMNIDLKQVENLQEKKKIENEDFMAKIAHAAKKGKKEVKIGDKTHKVTMDKDTAHKITKNEELSWEEAVKLATDTRTQSTKEYWEEQLAKKQEGWGGKGGVPGKGTVTTVRKKPAGGMTMGGKK